MITDRSQRWGDRRSRFVTDDTVIDPRRYAVDVVAHDTARAFVADHHYLARYPAAQLAVGLYGPGRGGHPSLDGIIVFSVPASGAVITRHTGYADPARGCVLQRLLCLPSVAANGESYFTARAFRLLRQAKPSIDAVVSFSDPQVGHCGCVYASLSGAYRGTTRPRKVLRLDARQSPTARYRKFEISKSAMSARSTNSCDWAHRGRGRTNTPAPGSTAAGATRC